MDAPSRAVGRILVVEDDAEVALTLRLLLEDADYQVEVVSCAEDAFDRLPSSDLLLTDVVLPGIDGYELCRRVRSLRGELRNHPIIVLSARGAATDRAKGIDIGANDYVAKPFDGDELIARIRGQLRTRQVEAQLREQTRELSAVRRLTATLVNTVNVAELAQRVVDAIPAAFGGSSGFIGGVLFAVEPDREIIRAHAVTDIPAARAALQLVQEPLERIEARYNPPRNILEHVALSGTPMEGEHLDDFISPTVPAATARAIEAMIRMRGAVALPVLIQRRLVGVFLFALAKQTSEITQIERELMRDFVDTIGIALENVRLYGEAARLTVTDELTGIANRRRFDQALAEEIERSARIGYPVSLLLVDVDHFKLFNDQFGHQHGDAVLRQVAAALRGNIRKTDLVARYGGEEFGVILPSTPLRGLGPIAEKLRGIVAGLPIRGVAGSAGVTVSIGGAASPPIPGDTDDLIRTADAALYAAKAAGRNRVVIDDTIRAVAS